MTDWPSVELKPIGLIHSPFKTKSEAPYQGSGINQVSEIEIFKDYQEGLKDIEGFSHLIVLYYFHKSEGCPLLVRTHLDSVSHGVFSTRSPYRPCPIGFSVVTLIGTDKNILKVRELDALDGTPVLDIKPYVPRIDQRAAVSIGWMEGKLQL